MQISQVVFSFKIWLIQVLERKFISAITLLINCPVINQIATRESSLVFSYIDFLLSSCLTVCYVIIRNFDSLIPHLANPDL